MSNTLDLILLPNPPEVPEQYNQIVRKSCNKVSYNEFFWNFMDKNWPVILTDVSNEWKCCKEWIKKISNTQDNGNQEKENKINFEYLKEKIGNVNVPVVDCNKEYYNSHAKIELAFFDFLDYWKMKQEADVLSETNGNIELKDDMTLDEKNLESEKIYYLKDWHLQANSPDYNFYKTPIHFSVDWLNEFLIETKKDDYRFVYMGPKDSWTPFHADVFGSFSWSTNILGLKKWTILPPGEEQKLADNLGNLPNRIFDNILKEKHIKHFTIIQKENEALFVPSGWYHQVWNITDTISINHNWFNGCNLKKIWENLVTNMNKVIKEIEDCVQMDNYDQHCQTMLKASFGMNYIDFSELLEYILDKRLKYCIEDIDNNRLIESSNNIFFNIYQPNQIQIKFDLKILNEVAEAMLQEKIIFDDRIGLYRRVLRIAESTQYNLCKLKS